MSNSPALLKKENILSDPDNDVNFHPNQSTSSLKRQLNIDRALENKLTEMGPDVALTKREKEILELVLSGNTNKEIAQKLYRTERTIEYHRNRMMRKLGTHNTIELVKYAIAMGIA